MRLTRCFRKRMLKVGAWILPVALAASLLPADSVGFAVKSMAGWLAAYLVMCVVWWGITQARNRSSA